MNSQWFILIACLTSMLSVAALKAGSSHTQAVNSPDGTLRLEFKVDDTGLVTYSFHADERELIRASPVGFAGGGFSGASTRSVDCVWKPVWGKR